MAYYSTTGWLTSLQEITMPMACPVADGVNLAGVVYSYVWHVQRASVIPFGRAAWCDAALVTGIASNGILTGFPGRGKPAILFGATAVAFCPTSSRPSVFQSRRAIQGMLPSHG